MILAVCLNPALDITYRISPLRRGTSHTADVVAERAGGKGVNVARVLHQMSEPGRLTGFTGGTHGATIGAELAAAGVDTAFTAIHEQTRRSVAIVDPDDVTVFNERGPLVTAGEWERFLAQYRADVTEADAVTLSGSLPRGLGDDAYAILVETAVNAEVPVLLDTSGAPLLAAVRSGPSIVCPNRSEVAHALGRQLPTVKDVIGAARELRSLGAGAVVVSNGVDGIVLDSADGTWIARPPRLVDGNPTGAGDALTAALACGVRHGDQWPTLIRAGIAWSAAAVATRWAGELDEQVLTETYRTTEVRKAPWE